MSDLVLGLDIGIASVGWALYNQSKKNIVDMGVRIFEEAETAKEPRSHRSARRNLRHKNWRKKQMLYAFVDFGIIPYDDVFEKVDGRDQVKTDYLAFAYKKEIKDQTVYHLRKRGLTEELTNRELLIALYNICKTRGHFLLETVNYEKDTISFELFKEKFLELISPYVDSIAEEDDFTESLLKPIFQQKIKANEIKREFKNKTFVSDEDGAGDKALQEICLLLRNNKADLSAIDESVQLPENTKKVDITELLKKDELNDFLNECIELYDLINVASILEKYNYICQKDVDLLEEVRQVYHKKDMGDNEGFEERKKELQKKMTKIKGDRIRAVKNVENKFPNGLYVKEAKAILRKQQETNPLITDEFIEICADIIKSRIPYYVGPLGENAKNGWAIKNGNFKYSYNYSVKNNVVDEGASIEEWKKRMISHCTYLPEEFALPKGSFIAETFNIVNELNNLDCKTIEGDDYYLTSFDKAKIFDQLFLKKKGTIAYKEIAELLNLKKCETKNKGTVQKFKTGYSLYYQIIEILPELKLDSIAELFRNSEKIEQLEKIILDINLFDEEDSKIKHFEKSYSKDISKKLSKMKSKSFYSYSKKFICSTVINKEGNSLLDALFDDNSSSFRNEQMTLISRATDLDGNPIDFTSNKYETKFRNGEVLGINLLIDEGKPVIPISRGVIRSLNETLKLYRTVVDMYGVPSKVVIETARELKDSSQTKEVPAKHFDKMVKYYDYIQLQLKDRKDEFKRKTGLEDWEKIEQYLNKNKRKVELYIRQNGRDMISGEKIDIDHLENYEIDHILPRGFGDNSLDNLMLINKHYNTMKNDRVPLMYIKDGAYTYPDGDMITEGDFVNRVTDLFKLGMISENKVQRLLLKNTDEVEGFINRNLVDTRYIIREFMSILNAYGKANNYDTHIVSLKSAFTSTYKHAFKIRKNRDIGDQHHSMDAAILVVADQILSNFYSNYDRRGNFKSYQELIRNMSKNDKESTKKMDGWIQYMYFKTFDHQWYDSESLIHEIKSIKPLYSLKAEKNYAGGYFDATIYPKEKKKDGGVLELIGINDDKKVFSSINCVAVDFFKYTDKKGKKKHVGIHIPKAIVDKEGNINKEKYMILVKDYYKVPELIDENGELKTYLFRLRVFKNDLIYDTKFNTVQKFNIGSIVNKKLEMKHVNCFSYEDMYAEFKDISKALIDRFNIKAYGNKDKNAVMFDKVDKKELIKFCTDNLMVIDDLNRYEKSILGLLKEEKDLDSFIEKVQFLNQIVNRPCTPPTIVGQYMPVANNPSFEEDTQYVKLKYSQLGIRYYIEENGTLIIEGPKYHLNAYSKIKKEEFSWRICPEVI